MTEPRYRCGIEAVLDLLGGKWKILIIYHLRGSQARFGDLRRMVGKISEKVLSQQLKEMVADGLVQRIDFHTVPPHVEYHCTDFGLDLCATLKDVCDWGTLNMEELNAVAQAREARSSKAASARAFAAGTV